MLSSQYLLLKPKLGGNNAKLSDAGLCVYLFRRVIGKRIANMINVEMLI